MPTEEEEKLKLIEEEKPKRKNPLFTLGVAGNTRQDTPTQLTSEEIVAQFAPPPDVQQKETPAPQPTPVLPVTPAPASRPSVFGKYTDEQIAAAMRAQEELEAYKQQWMAERIGQPSQHDMRSDVPAEKLGKNDNVFIYYRILPYYNHYMRYGGPSKKAAFNNMLVKFLISEGYPIDPDILNVQKHPFTWEDVPRDKSHKLS
jgi:hypothetical protein